MQHQQLPGVFLQKCTHEEATEVQAWWDGLKDDSRSSVCVLLDQRHDSRAFVYGEDSDGKRRWHVLPVTDDRLPTDDPSTEQQEGQLEFFQYLLDHEEVIIPTEATLRTFHICVAHPAARRVRDDGQVTYNFQCPVEAADCPIRALFRGNDVRRCRLFPTSAPQTMLAVGHN